MPAWCYSEAEREESRAPSRRLSRLTRRGAPRYPGGHTIPLGAHRCRDPPRLQTTQTNVHRVFLVVHLPTYLPTYQPTRQPTGSQSPRPVRDRLPFSVCVLLALALSLSLPLVPLSHQRFNPFFLLLLPRGLLSSLSPSAARAAFSPLLHVPRYPSLCRLARHSSALLTTIQSLSSQRTTPLGSAPRLSSPELASPRLASNCPPSRAGEPLPAASRVSRISSRALADIPLRPRGRPDGGDITRLERGPGQGAPNDRRTVLSNVLDSFRSSVPAEPRNEQSGLGCPVDTTRDPRDRSDRHPCHRPLDRIHTVARARSIVGWNRVNNHLHSIPYFCLASIIDDHATAKGGRFARRSLTLVRNGRIKKSLFSDPEGRSPRDAREERASRSVAGTRGRHEARGTARHRQENPLARPPETDPRDVRSDVSIWIPVEHGPRGSHERRRRRVLE